MNVLSGVSTKVWLGSWEENYVHEYDHLRGEVAANNLQTAQHDRSSLHGDRYRVGAPLALCGRVLRRCALFVHQGSLRVANKLFGVCIHVQAIRYARFRCQERRGELGGGPWGWSSQVSADAAREGI